MDVEGTLTAEDDPWPSDEVADQAERVADLAGRTAARDAEDPTALLLEYRVEAARLVLLCREAGG